MRFNDNVFKNSVLLISMPMDKAHFRILIFERLIGSSRFLKINSIENFLLYGSIYIATLYGSSYVAS